MTDEDYYVGGCTALLDAIGGAIDHIGNVHKYAREEDVPEKTIFIITTDGMENASKNYNYKKVKKLVESRKEKNGWEFIFLGANIDAVEVAGRFGINRQHAVDYEKENFEPNVPPLAERIETFKELSRRVGKDKVIWRFDPLIVTSGIAPRELLRRIWRIGNALKGYTEKLVFSFVDVRAYRKVQANLIKETGCFDRDSVVGAELNCEQRLRAHL